MEKPKQPSQQKAKAKAKGKAKAKAKAEKPGTYLQAARGPQAEPAVSQSLSKERQSQPELASLVPGHWTATKVIKPENLQKVIGEAKAGEHCMWNCAHKA